MVIFSVHIHDDGIAVMESRDLVSVSRDVSQDPFSSILGLECL